MIADRGSPAAAPPSFSFVLQPEFPLNALILASDALRIANQNSGRELFRWSFVSESGEAVRASNGMWVAVDRPLDAVAPSGVVLVFQGNLPTQNTSPKLLGFLRAAARFGALVGGIDTGAFALAQAGLVAIAERPDTLVHWEAVRTFQERFPQAEVHDQLFRTDGNTVQAAGGVATLDMMLDLVARFADEALANEVANALVHRRRPAASAQRSDGAEIETVAPLAQRLVALMESRLDFTLSLDELAAELGVSRRTLSRASWRTFGEPPMRLYVRVRLQAARNLLFYEEFSIRQVGLATGFSSASVFARAFKAQFETTPRAFRAALRASQMLAVRPEIRRLIGAAKAGSTAA